MTLKVYRDESRLVSIYCMFVTGGLLTHTSTVRVAGVIFRARTTETTDGIGAGRVGAARITKALVDVYQKKPDGK